MSEELHLIIIGAGNIGSRHAQALMRLENKISLTIFDVNQQALDVCKARVEEIKRPAGSYAAFYITDYAQLPESADLAIVATGSEHRLSSLEHLVKSTKCKCIILEKFLFPTLEEYEKASLLLENNPTTLVYVNCVKRMFEAYQFAKEKLKGTPGKINASVKGNNWGLAGNGVHYTDLFAYLTDSKISTIAFEDTSYTEIIESKRSGYAELTGKCHVVSENGDEMEIISMPGEYQEIECRIEKNGLEILVVEYGDRIEVIFDNEKTLFPYPFQSMLTKQYVEELLSKEKITLATYPDSAGEHKKFLVAFKELVNQKKHDKEWKIT